MREVHLCAASDSVHQRRGAFLPQYVPADVRNLQGKVNLHTRAAAWQDAQPSPDTAHKLEDSILTRARELRLATLGQVG